MALEARKNKEIIEFHEKHRVNLEKIIDQIKQGGFEREKEV